MSDLKNKIEELGGFKACEYIRVMEATGEICCKFKDKEVNFKIYVDRIADFISGVKPHNDNILIVEKENLNVIEELISKTLVRVENLGNEKLIMEDTEGVLYVFKHNQDCCETVEIEDICGDLNNLVGSPIIMAEETYSDKQVYNLEVWTFYKFATAKGYVTVRWYGSSDGCYSVGVDLWVYENGIEEVY